MHQQAHGKLFGLHGGGEVVVRLTEDKDVRGFAGRAVLKDQAWLDHAVPDVALQPEAGVDGSAVGARNAALAAERHGIGPRAARDRIVFCVTLALGAINKEIVTDR